MRSLLYSDKEVGSMKSFSLNSDNIMRSTYEDCKNIETIIKNNDKIKSVKTTKDKNVKKEPPLRFPGFNDEWKKERLGNVVSFKNGYAFRPDSMLSTKQGNVLPIITIKNLIHSSYVNTEGIRYHVYNDNLSKFLIKGENILIAMSGATVGKISLTKEGSMFFQNQRVGCMEVNDKSRIYIYNYLISELTQSRIKVLSIGTGQPNISTSDIKNLKISLPSLEEQSKIGSFFKTLDTLIEKQESYIDKLEKEKKGLLQDIFSRDLRLLDDNGEKFEGEWKEVKLGDFKEGFVLEKNNLNDYLEIGDICVETKNYIISPKKAPKGSKCVPKNTLLISKVRPTRGAFTVTRGALLCSPALYDIYNDCEYTISFLKASITNHWFNYRMDVLSTGTTYPSVKNKDISNHNILAPSLPEQKAIGLFFKKIDDKIEKERELLEKYKEMKKGLLQDMFI